MQVGRQVAWLALEADGFEQASLGITERGVERRVDRLTRKPAVLQGLPAPRRLLQPAG